MVREATTASRYPPDPVSEIARSWSVRQRRAELEQFRPQELTPRFLILPVSHRAQMAASWVGSSVAMTGRITPAVRAMIDRGEWHQEQFPDNGVMTVGLTQSYMGALRAFLPGESTGLLRGAGMQVLRCGGLGSLAGLCDRELVKGISKDSVLLEPFLDVCEQFDSEILPSGPGTRLRAGLIAVALRRE